MENKLLILTAVTTFGFALWPLVARKAGLPQAWILLFLGVALIIASLITKQFFPDQRLVDRDETVPLIPALGLLCLAVALNAGSSISFTGITTSSSHYAPLYIITVMALVPVFSKIGAHFINNEPINWVNVIGMIGVLVSIGLVGYQKT